MVFPTSGSFLGPKTSVATPAITTSSGIPSPNIQLHDKPPPLFLPDLFLSTTTTTWFKGFNVLLLNKDEFEEENIAAVVFEVGCEIDGVDIIIIIRWDEIAMFFVDDLVFFGWNNERKMNEGGRYTFEEDDGQLFILKYSFVFIYLL